jgi:hypothetical protein
MSEPSLLLPDLITRERDDTLLIALVAEFLAILKFAPKSSQYVNCAKRLRSTNFKERRAALSELGCKV